MNFRELMERHGIPVVGSEHRHGRENWQQIDCPYCGRGSRKFHMGFNELGGYLNCWKCGRHDLWETLQKLINLPKRELSRVVKGLKANRTLTHVEKPRGRLQLPKGISDLSLAHRRYLSGRGFQPDEIAQLWEVRGIGLAAKLQWRLFIPIHFQGRIVSWTTRAISDDAPARYINARPEHEDVPIGELLYGEDYARHTVIVVEGPTDVWNIGPGAVASCGVGYSLTQVSRIAKYPRRVICFDRNASAQAEKLADDLSVFDGATFQVDLDAEDPGSAPPAEIKRLRDAFLRI